MLHKKLFQGGIIMKSMIFLFFLLLVFGCNSDTPVQNNSDISTSFTLSNTSGVSETIFHSGESFDMHFVLHNFSGTDLIYNYTGYEVMFQMEQEDSIIASSIDGLGFYLNIMSGKVKDGESFTSNWRAPNTVTQDPKIILPVGTYKARVLHKNFFNNYQVPATKEILFSIVPP